MIIFLSKKMDFLIDLFGPDVFSIIHEYAGQIIEDLRYCKRIWFDSLSSSEQQFIYRKTIDSGWEFNSLIIYWVIIFTVKIDNVLYKIFSFSIHRHRYYVSIFKTKKKCLSIFTFISSQNKLECPPGRIIIMKNIGDYDNFIDEFRGWYKANWYNLFRKN